MSQRTERVDELLRQEIGEIVAREIADPRVGFATITEVETTPDLRHAKVWVSWPAGTTQTAGPVPPPPPTCGVMRCHFQTPVQMLPPTGTVAVAAVAPPELVL